MKTIIVCKNHNAAELSFIKNYIIKQFKGSTKLKVLVDELNQIDEEQLKLLNSSWLKTEKGFNTNDNYSDIEYCVLKNEQILDVLNSERSDFVAIIEYEPVKTWLISGQIEIKPYNIITPINDSRIYIDDKDNIRTSSQMPLSAQEKSHYQILSLIGIKPIIVDENGEAINSTSLNALEPYQSQEEYVNEKISSDHELGNLESGLGGLSLVSEDS
jgi:hypothetical protein